MATLNREDVLTKRTHIYSFLQRRPGPRGRLELFSLHGALGSAEQPLGEPEPRYRKSVTRRGAWDRVGEVSAPPDTPTTSFTELMPRATATYLEQLRKSGEPFAVHAIIHQNADPQNYSRWESKEVLDGVRLTSFTRNEAEGEDDDLVSVEAEAQYAAYDRLFHLYCGEKAGSLISKAVVAVAVYPDDDRGDPQRVEIYAVQKVDTSAPKLVYSRDGGATWAAVSLTALGTNEPNDLAVVGDYLLIVSATGGAYYYASRDDLSAWTQVTSGFVSGKGPTAIYAPAVGDIFIAGQGGYVYHLTVPGRAVTVLEAGNLTTQNLADIGGAGDTVVAVGANNAVLYSGNRGSSWTTPTGPAAGVALNAVAVWDKQTFWVGADKLYFTDDGGKTWLDVPLGVSGLTAVKAVTFCRDLRAVGYVGAQVGTTTRLLRTTDYGAEWEALSLHGYNTANEAVNGLAVSGPNMLVAGGLVSATPGDGFLTVAK
jgi:photosystem II stability/assembly factor-like uncharacterized protein